MQDIVTESVISGLMHSFYSKVLSWKRLALMLWLPRSCLVGSCGSEHDSKIGLCSMEEDDNLILDSSQKCNIFHW